MSGKLLLHSHRLYMQTVLLSAGVAETSCKIVLPLPLQVLCILCMCCTGVLSFEGQNSIYFLWILYQTIKGNSMALFSNSIAPFHQGIDPGI